MCLASTLHAAILFRCHEPPVLPARTQGACESRCFFAQPLRHGATTIEGERSATRERFSSPNHQFFRDPHHLAVTVHRKNVSFLSLKTTSLGEPVLWRTIPSAAFPFQKWLTDLW